MKRLKDILQIQVSDWLSVRPHFHFGWFICPLVHKVARGSVQHANKRKLDFEAGILGQAIQASGQDEAKSRQSNQASKDGLAYNDYRNNSRQHADITNCKGICDVIKKLAKEVFYEMRIIQAGGDFFFFFFKFSFILVPVQKKTADGRMERWKGGCAECGVSALDSVEWTLTRIYAKHT